MSCLPGVGEDCQMDCECYIQSRVRKNRFFRSLESLVSYGNARPSLIFEPVHCFLASCHAYSCIFLPCADV